MISMGASSRMGVAKSSPSVPPSGRRIVCLSYETLSMAEKSLVQ